MSNKYTHDDFLNKLQKFLGNKYECVSKYEGINKKIKLLHLECGSVWETTPKSIYRGSQCTHCSKRPRRTNDSFVKQVHDIVGDEYCFLEKYAGSNTRILVRHNKCGYEYKISPGSFINYGYRCANCSKRKKKTTSEFKKEVKDLVGEEYFVLGEYINSYSKISMKHNYCGKEWSITPHNFLNGHRCGNCFKRRRWDTTRFKKELWNKHRDNYSAIGKYVNSETKIKLLHNDCGYEFEMLPSMILSVQRCPRCFGTPKKTTNQFKEEIYSLVGDEYELLSEYITNKAKVKIKHLSCHSDYLVTPSDFLSGNRCPICNESKGEKYIRDLLNHLDVNFESQYTFVDCKYRSSLKFDFAIFDNSKHTPPFLLVEYDGQQHFEPVEYWGGEKTLKRIQRRDKIKNEYCKNNDIQLLRIPYWDFDRIEEILMLELAKICI